MTFEQDYDILINFAKDNIFRKKLRLDAADLVNDAFIKHSDSGRPYKLSDIKKLIIGKSFKELNHEMIHVSEFWKPHIKLTSSYCKKCGDEKPISGFYLYDNNTILAPFGLCKSCYIENQLEYYNANKQKCLDASREYKEKNKDKIKIKKQEYWIKNRVTKEQKPKQIKFKKFKFRRRKNLLREIKPPKVKLTIEEKRLKWNAYMRSRTTGKPRNEYLKDIKETARPIKELWKEATKRYQAKQRENLTDTYIKSLLKRFGEITLEMIIEKRKQLQEKKTA